MKAVCVARVKMEDEELNKVCEVAKSLAVRYGFRFIVTNYPVMPYDDVAITIVRSKRRVSGDAFDD